MSQLPWRLATEVMRTSESCGMSSRLEMNNHRARNFGESGGASARSDSRERQATRSWLEGWVRRWCGDIGRSRPCGSGRAEVSQIAVGPTRGWFSRVELGRGWCGWRATTLDR